MIFNLTVGGKDMSIEEKFKHEYKNVFTDDNVVKACGRNNCKKLIELASELDSTENYGNTETGVMNINNMIKLHDKVVYNK